jgi:hypothetical protein
VDITIWNNEYHCYALHYQIFASVCTREIIHLAGSFKGAAADIIIARQTIILFLQPGEKIWADKSYANFKYFILKRGKITKELKKSNKAIYRVKQIVERSFYK